MLGTRTPTSADGQRAAGAADGRRRCACSAGSRRRAWTCRRRRARRPAAGVDAGAGRPRRRATATTKRLVRDLDLHTVCEEAGCPNIYECWADRTATFMILGERCTRACGFCLVDTRQAAAARPRRARPGSPRPWRRSASSTRSITSVARDDLDDGGAAGFAATIRAMRAAHAADTRSRCSSPTARATRRRST